MIQGTLVHDGRQIDTHGDHNLAMVNLHIRSTEKQAQRTQCTQCDFGDNKLQYNNYIVQCDFCNKTIVYVAQKRTMESLRNYNRHSIGKRAEKLP